jgi:hypothetical protein
MSEAKQSDSTELLGLLPEPDMTMPSIVPDGAHFYRASTVRSNEREAAAWNEGFSAGNDWRQSVTEFWSDRSSGNSPPAPKNPYA